MNAISFIGPIRCARWTDQPEAQALLAEAVANPPEKRAFRANGLTERYEDRYTGPTVRQLRTLHEAAKDQAIAAVQAGHMTRAEALLVWDLTPTKAIDEARKEAGAFEPVEEGFTVSDTRERVGV